jgi:hypothetical protein
LVIAWAVSGSTLAIQLQTLISATTQPVEPACLGDDR